jgi:hypothetical protein
VIVIFLMAAFYEWATTMSGRLDRYFQAKNTTPRKTIQPLAAVIANNGAASSPSSATGNYHLYNFFIVVIGSH